MLRYRSKKDPDDYVWRVTDKFIGYLDDETCFELSASGLELQFIKDRFSNIPLTNATEVFWRGEFAQFIYDNLLVF
jgi:hypothetical protein